jgi:dolichol-phosphate mannosyltransferase
MVELSVVIPTVNERDNIRPLIAALDTALAGIAWEAIFVDDDSADDTAGVIRTLATARDNIRLIERIGRRGLASACTEGMLASHAPYIAVLDADLQHDAGLLPRMLGRLKAEPLDLVIGSRHVGGGSVGAFAPMRRRLSRLGTQLSRLVLRTRVQDPMSGFFMLRSSFLHETVRDLSNTGFKILLDLLLSSPRPVRFAELPFTFGTRHAGASKLDTMASLEYLQLIADKSLGRVIPVRYVLFVLVGGLGVLVHLSVLGLLHRGLALPFGAAQALATLVAMTGNFFTNNMLTYRDRRLHGSDLWWGLSTFCLACSIGAIMNFVVAQLMFGNGTPWALAGLAGAFAGSVWNYATTATFTWQRRRPTRPLPSGLGGKPSGAKPSGTKPSGTKPSGTKLR